MAEPTVVGAVPPKAPNSEPAAPKDVTTKRRPAKQLPTTRVGFAKQVLMARSYAELGGEKPATTPEVAKVVGVHPNTAVYANPFLVDAGFLQKAGNGYIAAPEVVAYHRAMAWNPETAGAKLAPLLQKTWFARRLLPKLTLRPVEEKEALEELAHDAAVGTEFTGQLALLLDYLALAGLIRREGGMIYPGNSAGDEASPRPEPVVADRVEALDTPREPRRAANIATAFSQAPEGVLRFNVDVSVDMREFATWRPDRIAAFWAGIAQVLAAKAAVETESSR